MHYARKLGFFPALEKSRKFNGMKISEAILKKYKSIGCRLFQRLNKVKHETFYKHNQICIYGWILVI